MTLTKADIAKTVMETVHFRRRDTGGQRPLFPELDYDVLSKRRATELVDTVFEIIKKALEKGDNVRIPGFGNFQAKFRWARKGRNPKTGKQIILKSRRVVSFRYSSKLRARINKDMQ